MKIGASIKIDQRELDVRNDPWGYVGEQAVQILLREMKRAFPDGCCVESGEAERWPGLGYEAEIIIRLSVVQGDAQPDLPTLRPRIHELLIAALGGPKAQSSG